MWKKNLITEKHIQLLQKDSRKGVQSLLLNIKKSLEKERLLKDKFLEMLQFERRYWNDGYNYVAGVDEAGRGPLAGPVVAAAVILPKDFYLPGINDSKTLSEKERKGFYDIIIDQAISYDISYVMPAQIDQLNILSATKLAMTNSILNLSIQPDVSLIDAVTLEKLPMITDIIIKGDEKSVSIAAASILAKVSRDRYMADMHKKYPNYLFNRHKGYGTAEHLKRLKRYGISPIHRQSFAPVQRYI